DFKLLPRINQIGIFYTVKFLQLSGSHAVTLGNGAEVIAFFDFIGATAYLATGWLSRRLRGLRRCGRGYGAALTFLKAIVLHHALSDCTSLGGKHVIAAHGCDVNATVHKSTLNQYGVLVRFSDLV